MRSLALLLVACQFNEVDGPADPTTTCTDCGSSDTVPADAPTASVAQ